MQRALTLIIVLSLLCFGCGIRLDRLQRDTAQAYLEELAGIRTAVQAGEMEDARMQEALLHARWQHDSSWLNCMISHHHTRNVSSALLHLATALEMGWPARTLYALDEVVDAMKDIRDADFCRWENIL